MSSLSRTYTGLMGEARFPGESSEYRKARDRLLQVEIELRRALEAVAAQRRELPPGGEVPEDYAFEEAEDGGATTEVRLSELFTLGKDTLVIYSFMFPRAPGDERPGPESGQTAELPLSETPCASCVSIIDSLDGAAPHVDQRISLAVVAKSEPERIRAFTDERGWRQVRLLSSARNNYNRDYLAETEDGAQMPMLNVFTRDGDTIRHFWGTELLLADWDPGQEPRHVDLIWPVWQLLDVSPEGRGTDWEPALSYGDRRA
jgi:predicted dithiol-disulfide oxidoreductase (DUF899 family)